MADAAPRPDPAAPYVFVSYASVDRERVMPIVVALRGAGVPVWLDQQGIGGGENYAAEINAAIQRCAAFVLMCSAASLGSRNVKQEIALGWEYERPYVPLLLEPVAIPGDVKYWLTAAQWIEVREKGGGASGSPPCSLPWGRSASSQPLWSTKRSTWRAGRRNSRCSGRSWRQRRKARAGWR